MISDFIFLLKMRRFEVSSPKKAERKILENFCWGKKVQTKSRNKELASFIYT